MRTNRSAAKRFKKTAAGKVKRSHAYARHQMRAKTRKAKRHLRKAGLVSAADLPAVRKMLPYL
jgi:large subunit ribosomal protein L35